MQAVPAETLPSMSVEEYLEFEKHSDLRHELVDGYVYAMTGASDRHEDITINLLTVLHSHLRGTPCRVYSSNLKVRVDNNFYYPDIFARCESNRGDPYYKTDPVLIIEVLSPTAQRYDRGDKRQTDQSIQTLQEYVLIAQDTISVELYRRVTGWQKESLSADAVLTLSSIEFSCPVQQIYAGISG